MTTELDTKALRARATYALKEGTCPIMDPEIVLALLDGYERADKYEAALRGVMPLIDEFGDTQAYGPFPGGDPRNFVPDEEDCSPQEIAAWKAACAEWDAGNGEDRGPSCATMGDGSVWTGTGFGMGIYTWPTPPEVRAAREALEEPDD